MSARDQLLFDLFVTALEGGIGYWSECSEYHWMNEDRTEDKRGFRAVIHDEDHKRYVVNRKVMDKGLMLAATEWRDKLDWSSGDKPPLVVTVDTDWDYDAGDADMVLQLGLFEDVVYG